MADSNQKRTARFRERQAAERKGLPVSPASIGRPQSVVDPTTLPPLLKVLRPHLDTADKRRRTGIASSILSRLTNGENPNPSFFTLQAILAGIRPDDMDGGWAWLGKELIKAKSEGRTNAI